MKIYTEEQVRKIYCIAFLGGHGKYIMDFEEDVKLISPIELPSDEEIREASKNVDRPGLFWENEFARDSFVQCGKWLKEQILNQNK